VHLLFVYGTLKSGHRNHNHWLSGMSKVAEGYIEGYDMYDLPSAGYPLIAAGNGQVHGELYVVSDELITRLDRFEANYIRNEVEFIPLSDRSKGVGYDAEVYVWDNAIPAVAVPVKSGVYTGPVSQS